ncbi:MAG: P13 family porin [Treponema maltophilum]
MKKLLFICLCMGAVFFLYAQESPAQTAPDAQPKASVSEENADLQEAHEKNSADRIAAINTLLKNKELKKNFDGIRTEAMGLSFAEKNALFSKHKSASGISAAINFFIGYGIGSFVQKDTVNGVICLSADLVASGLFIGSQILFDKYYKAYLSDPHYWNISSSNPFETEAGKAIGLLITSGIILGIARIYEIAAPFLYSYSYNEKLREALCLKNAQISFSPIVMPDASCGLALSIRY